MGLSLIDHFKSIEHILLKSLDNVVLPSDMAKYYYYYICNERLPRNHGHNWSHFLTGIIHISRTNSYDQAIRNKLSQISIVQLITTSKSQ